MQKILVRLKYASVFYCQTQSLIVNLQVSYGYAVESTPISPLLAMFSSLFKLYFLYNRHNLYFHEEERDE